MQLENRVALIVGSTSGIGEAMAKAFASEGALVVVNGRRQEAGDRVVKAIEEAGGKATFIQADITKVEDCERLIEETVKTYGGFDILINNAGIAKPASMEELDLELWDSTYNTNIRSYFVLIKKALPHLLKSEHANIINTSSLASIRAFDQQFSYGSTKAAVSQFTRMLAVSYADKGIRVNGIAPGVIDTDILANAPEEYIDAIADGIPMKRLGQPEEIANLAVFLASDKASYITGQIILCDGGSSL